MLNTIHGWGISARAHVHIALLYLRNGSTDCVQICYVGWRPLSTCFPQVMGGVGHLCTCARAPLSPYLRIRVANCAKTLCVARDPIVTRFTRVEGGVTTFARACPVSLSRKPLSPGIEATPKQTYLFRARSFIAKHGVLLVLYIYLSLFILFCPLPIQRTTRQRYGYQTQDDWWPQSPFSQLSSPGLVTIPYNTFN